MHHTVSHPRTGSLVRVERGDTFEVLLRQRSERHGWRVAMAPYGTDLLTDQPRAGTSGVDATRRLMFRAMRGGGGILRLERTLPSADDEGAEYVDLVVAIGR
ncbi:hypothetical protein EKO23_18045 [Nocardioides guangzhouensis]|uniref:Proteinase inhibitor I42 chagasin domain-containing protein n=1 Tax=Nocardioides guangzhouensis TaxID=2497878 RepID=A0A4Q4Z7Q3_9ACTN|nr:hypothetical protein [Nocardioides guangzhouensis]RYP83803.1 hypothetical protein EKO23_18045 [Nocardioides guangzhouensis]